MLTNIASYHLFCKVLFQRVIYGGRILEDSATLEASGVKNEGKNFKDLLCQFLLCSKDTVHVVSVQKRDTPAEVRREVTLLPT